MEPNLSCSRRWENEAFYWKAMTLWGNNTLFCIAKKTYRTYYDLFYVINKNILLKIFQPSAESSRLFDKSQLELCWELHQAFFCAATGPADCPGTHQRSLSCQTHQLKASCSSVSSILDFFLWLITLFSHLLMTAYIVTARHI